MKRSWWAVVAVVVVVAIAAWWWLGRGPAGGPVAVDLVEAFRAAEKRTPLDPSAAFSMDPQTIKGETKPAVFAHPPSRIIYHDVTIPEHAELQAWLAIKEEAWDKGTDGVYFRLGVSRGEDYKDLITRTLDPYRQPADRNWVFVSADLSAYAGQKVNIVLNTHPSPPGSTNNNAMYDFALFGAPRIVSRAAAPGGPTAP